METWFIILITICIPVMLKSIIELLIPSKKPTHKLPPGPPTIPIISNFLWLRRSSQEIESILRTLFAKLGPMVTLRMGSYAAIIVADRSLAHKALIQNGAVFADRPKALVISKIESSNQHTINTASYGPTWRVLRRNLTEKILNPSRVKSYSHARKWALGILLSSLKSEARSGDHHAVPVLVHFQYAMFCLLVLMCFGDKLEEKQIMEVLHTQRRLFSNINKFNILNFLPMFTKIVFRKKWQEFYEILRFRKDVLIPLIRKRKEVKEGKVKEKKDEYVLCYVDTLLDLQLPDEKRNLDEEEMLSLCSEFLNAGTDTTSTALQWIMANLVKYPEIQERLLMEIKGVMKDREDEEEIKEDDLQKMPYLRAVILEGLRRHPPSHFLLPHAVTGDTILDEFLVPKKNGIINFMVAEMGWDPKAWKDPMDFKPERFLSDEKHEEVAFDITGSKEIKMMPFGAGRRICPGLGLAMLHLEYFVANLIWSFEWKPEDEDHGVDLDEKEDFLIVMKNPLKAYLSPRFL